MDDELLWPVMYLDQDLLKDMHSLILSGTIDTRSIKLIKEKTLTGKGTTDIKEDQYNQDKSSESEKEGYINNSLETTDHGQYTQTNNLSLEDKDNIHIENEIKKTFLTFALHSELSNELDNKNLTKYIDVDSLNENTVKEGELIKIRGTLISDSIISYLKASSQLLECFGVCEKKEEIKDTDKKAKNSLDNFPITYNVINHMLKNMIDILEPTRSKDITWSNLCQDIILKCGNIKVILTVNKDSFRNNSIYDKSDCPCTVFGKVIKVVKQGESISMLRQTTQAKYYENILDICKQKFSEIKDTYGIPIPSMPELECEGFALVIMPISICM